MELTTPTIRRQATDSAFNCHGYMVLFNVYKYGPCVKLMEIVAIRTRPHLAPFCNRITCDQPMIGYHTMVRQYECFLNTRANYLSRATSDVLVYMRMTLNEY